MNLVKQFFLCENLNINGRMAIREAVRAIIFQGDRILMVYSTVNGDYKFPGGGVKEQESHKEALTREIKEECGLIVNEIQGALGFVEEYNKPKESGYDVYKQISYYYLCTVQKDYVGLGLEEYEKQLGFGPKWVEIEKALEKNRAVLKGDFGKPPVWTTRDTYVLENLPRLLTT